MLWNAGRRVAPNIRPAPREMMEESKGDRQTHGGQGGKVSEKPSLRPAVRRMLRARGPRLGRSAFHPHPHLERGFRDAAIALKAYARQAKNKTLEADAFEIRKRAERCVGEMMEEGKADRRQRGERGKKRVSEKPSFDKKPSLAEVGIDKNLADRARKLAAMPAKLFEQQIAEGRDLRTN